MLQLKPLQAKTRFLKNCVLLDESRTESGAPCAGAMEVKVKATDNSRNESTRRRIVVVLGGRRVGDKWNRSVQVNERKRCGV